MKPAYWIGILAVVGGVIGYATYRTTGWVGASVGVVVGILAGTALYAALRRKAA